MPFFYPVSDLKLTGKTLIVPIVSTANVSQLAVDLLVASLSLLHVGTFDSRDLVPVVGAREDGEKGITTPLELYGKQDIDVVIVQQRSPVLKSRKQDFVDSLLGFIKNSGLSSVIFLSGMDLINRTDAQMFTPTYYIQPPNSPPFHSKPLSSLKELPIPAYTSPVSAEKSNEDATIPFIPGGGLTRRILSSIPEHWSIPTASLLQFALEGDNRADAQLFAAVVAKVVGVDSVIQGQWRQPSSWTQGLFGTPHDQTLYG